MQLRTIYCNTHVHTFYVCLCLLALTFVCNSAYLLKCPFQIYQKSIVVFIRSSKVWLKTTSCAKGPVTRCNFPGNLQRNSTLIWPMHQPEMRCNNGNRRRHQAPEARASRGVWENAHPEKFLNLEPCKCDFLRFESNIWHQTMFKSEGFLKMLLIFRCIHKSDIWHGGAMVKVAEQ